MASSSFSSSSLRPLLFPPQPIVSSSILYLISVWNNDPPNLHSSSETVTIASVPDMITWSTWQLRREKQLSISAFSAFPGKFFKTSFTADGLSSPQPPWPGTGRLTRGFATGGGPAPGAPAPGLCEVIRASSRSLGEERKLAVQKASSSKWRPHQGTASTILRGRKYSLKISQDRKFHFKAMRAPRPTRLAPGRGCKICDRCTHQITWITWLPCEFHPPRPRRLEVSINFLVAFPASFTSTCVCAVIRSSCVHL